MSIVSCKHPLKAWKIGINEDTGKDKLKITSYDVDFVRYDRFTNGEHCVECHGKPLKTDFLVGTVVNDFIEIPCGHCIGCRMRYSRDWANRMMLEAQEHDSNLFLTLTYDNEHLPEPNEIVVEDTGEVVSSPVHPLVKRDVQLFMKRLRKEFSEQKIRFYACGEYGSQNMRPHYHLILFGLSIDDLVVNGKNELGQVYYVSPTIKKLWKYGFHVIAKATWETCAYTARYVTKKLYSDSNDVIKGYSPYLSGKRGNIYEEYNFPREFSTMSRKPGIARNFYDNNVKEIYKNQEIFLFFENKPGKKIMPPKYFDKLYDIDYPEESAILKEKRRKIAEQNNKMKQNLTSLEYLDSLKVEEENQFQRSKALKRSL